MKTRMLHLALLVMLPGTILAGEMKPYIFCGIR